MSKGIQIVALILLSIALIAVRMFAERLFYDPLILFFKTSHTVEALPPLEMSALLLNITMRYGLNMLLSLGILWFVFKNKEVLKISLVIYSVLFVLLLGSFYYFLNTSEAGQHLGLFYVRRFLIQPLLLLLLLPAFYFQKVNNRK